MAFYDKFPYTNFQELNLDKITERIESIDESVAEATAQAAAASASADSALKSKNAAKASEEAAKASEISASLSATGLSDALEEMELTNDRIDNLIVDGTPTEGNTELLDIRVGYNGTTYPTAGTAVRTQVGNLNTDIESISETFTSSNVYNPAEAVQGTLNTSGGVNESSYITTGFIPVSEGDVLYGYYVRENAFQENAVMFYVVSLFDENQTFISRTSTLFSHSYTVPANCAYIRATFQISFTLYRNTAMVTRNAETTVFEEYFAPYKTAKDTIARNNAAENKTLLDEITEIVISANVYNSAEAVQGTLSITGTINTSTYTTSGFIEVEESDVLYGYFIQNGIFRDANVLYLVALYDENKNFISRTNELYVHSYTVPSGCHFVRITFPITYSIYRNVIMVTRNAEATEYEAYFAPYISAIDRTARNADVNTKIIDCWGDSRIEMIATAGTAISDYLLALLGNDYITSNHGISGQNANMVACRFGSNEVYLTFENNQIPASGNANITAFKCSAGGKDGEDFRCASIAVHDGVHCEIEGIKGTIIRRYTTEQYFVRDAEGQAKTVIPRTKAIVTDYGSRKHACIFWAGKNDFGFNPAPRVTGIVDSVSSMAKSLGHDYFIILGETYSVNDDYADGTTFRTAVNTINNQYAAKYPNNYINIQAELISRGLSLEGITPTAQDTANIERGFIPDSLMADKVHLNEYGREATAKIIYSWMQTNGWI